MKSHATVATRFSTTCAGLVLLTLILGSVTIYQVGGIQTSLQAIVGDSLPGVYQISMLDSEVFELRGNYWKHIANSDKTAMANIESANESLKQKIQDTLRSYEKTISGEEDRRLFANIKAPYERYVAAWEEVAPLSRAGKTAEAVAKYIAVADPAHAQLKTAVRGLVDWNRKNGDSNADRAEGLRARVWRRRSGLRLGPSSSRPASTPGSRPPARRPVSFRALRLGSTRPPR